ncbi:MAG TPA: hypothetical protein VM869_23385 [Enhygromyxa sp.]|nr:hypothetical protein [Enhygromyxa sp.]
MKPSPVDQDLADRRTLWSSRALHETIKILNLDLKACEGKWTKLLTESMQRMNEPLRLDVDEDKLAAKRAKDMLLEARKYRRERDDLEEEKRDELKVKKRTIAGFVDALNECMAIESDDANTDQLKLYDQPGTVAGMGWASEGTQKSILAAIRLLEEKGVKLNQVLSELMVDLGTAGIEPVALSLSAGEAIENDTPVPEANEDQPANGGSEQAAASAAPPF